MVYTLGFFFLQNAVCFIIPTYLVPVLFTFYIQGVLKLKNNSGAKRLVHLRVVNNSYNRSQQDALFLNFILVMNCTCFGQTYCPSSGVLILYSQQLVFVVPVMLAVCQRVPS